jgi:hypothetical protein
MTNSGTVALRAKSDPFGRFAGQHADVTTVSKSGAATGHQDESKEKSMQYAMLIYETPENFESRKKRDNDDYIVAWRAYHKALVEAGVHAGGDPLHPPETATTVKVKDGRRQVQDGPFADTRSSSAGSQSSNARRSTSRSNGRRAAPLQRPAPWKSARSRPTFGAASRIEGQSDRTPSRSRNCDRS